MQERTQGNAFNLSPERRTVLSPRLQARFHQSLTALDTEVGGHFCQLCALLDETNRALASRDLGWASRLAFTPVGPAELLEHLDRTVEIQLARYSPMGRDLRFLLTCARVVPELHRSAQLVRHIAGRVRIVAGLPSRLSALVGAMGEATAEMWAQTATAWTKRDPGAASRLDSEDNEIDELAVVLRERAGTENVSLPVALELSLIERFYERLGDHAVHVAARIRWLALG
jgi:phosphate transport system protein